jgi:ubiquinone/menaquinone biosynthesis C-methylase UbiE
VAVLPAGDFVKALLAGEIFQGWRAWARMTSKGISLGYLSKYYDLITPAHKSRFRRNQIALLNLREGERVLEVGCGTGVLSLLAKMIVGEGGAVEGIDIAPKMVARARQKAEKAGLAINFRVASIDELPYRHGVFDAVISSMMFHHLPVATKGRGLEEVYRVLRTGGRLLLCDFCSPRHLAFPIACLMFIWISSTRYQLFGRLPALLEASSFRGAKLVKKEMLLEYYLLFKEGNNGTAQSYIHPCEHRAESIE